MRQDIRVLDRVRGAYASLRPSEQRVADYVLKDPETCTRCTISELADQVQVSQPTVIRFVQALGFDGYRNFKNGRAELIQTYPNPLYEGETADPANQSAYPSIFDEPLTFELFTAHQELSERAKG